MLDDFPWHRTSPPGCFVQDITQNGIQLWLDDREESGSGVNYILKNRVGGLSDPGIHIAGVDFGTAVGLHASMGITYDLEALRVKHGDAAVGCFSTVWGLDDYASGFVTLFAMLSTDTTTGVTDLRKRSFSAGQGDFLSIEIPRAARYLTLVSAASGPDFCDHGTFARPVITQLPCPAPRSSWVWNFAPTRVSPAGEPIALSGENLDRVSTVRLGGIELASQSAFSKDYYTGVTPALAPGFYDLEIVENFKVTGPVTLRIPRAIEVAPPPVLVAIVPSVVLEDRPFPISIVGMNFRSDMIFRVDDVGSDGAALLVSNLIYRDEFQFLGYTPPNENGFHPDHRFTPDVILYDQGRPYFFPGRITYVGTGIEKVEPSTVSTEGGTEVTFVGAGFTAGMSFTIEGIAASNVAVLDSGHARGVTPRLAEGFHDVKLVSSTGSHIFTRQYAVQAVSPGPPAIASVTPTRVYSLGGTELTIVIVFPGDRLDRLRPRIGGQPLLDVTYHAATGDEGNSLTGFTPPLPLGIYTVDVVDANGKVLASLPNAVEVVSLPPPKDTALLGPEQIEGTLAEGKARFIWNNPVPAREILVQDELGTILKRLPGNTNFFELAVSPATSVTKVGFVSIFDETRHSDLITSSASRLQCLWPPPLMGLDTEGIQDMTITGGAFDNPLTRCDASSGGGGTTIGIPNLSTLKIKTVREAGLYGAVITDSTADRINRFDPDLFLRLSKHLFTGFTLDQDSDQLQIDGFYTMPVYALGLKLKGRLIHVFPEDGFVDEFTFPEILPGILKDWNGVTYFRADRDVSETDARPCGVKIPAGDYLLELFAVGGDADTPHFVFQNDGRDEELFIQGVPCPPYPRVRITDLTGRRTLPIITQVSGQQVGNSNEARFEAIGYWLDENNRRHSLDPKDSSFVPHTFEFKWEVHDREPPTPRTEAGRSDTTIPVAQIGCYQVDVTVRDVACDRKAKRLFEVPIYPSVFSCGRPYYNVQNPTPSPGSVRGVVGFKNLVAAGLGNAPGHRERFRVFVMPAGCCGGVGKQCPAPEVGDIEFRLASRGELLDDFKVYDVPPTSVLDLCPDVQNGPKYFEVAVNLDNVDTVPGANNGVYKEVYLSARVVTYRDPALGGAARDVRGKDFWYRVGPPMLLTNRPNAIANTFWSSSYVRANGAYTFQMQSSRGAVESTKLPDSNPLKFLESLVGAEIPPFPSNINTALNTGIRIVNGGKWEPEKALSSMGGKVLGNQLDGSPVAAEVKKIADAIPEKLEWEWSDHRKIFEKHFEQKLFETIVWTGVIVVVPVTIWASIGIGFDFAIESDAHVKIAPFNALVGGNYFESDLGVTSKLDVSLPAELRTDVLFGVVSQSFSAIVNATSAFGTGIRARNTRIGPYLDLSVKLNVLLLSKICLFWYLCYPQYIIPLLNNASLIDCHFPPGHVPPGGGGDGGGEEQPALPDDAIDALVEAGVLPGGGGGGLNFNVLKLYEELTNPAIGTSPDRNRTLGIYFSSLATKLTGDLSTLQTNGTVRKDAVILESPELGGPGPFDLSIAFLTKDRALIASNATYPEESGLAFPFSPDHIFSRLELNELKAQDEAVVSFGQVDVSGIKFARTIRLSDPLNEVTALGRRADGRPSIAASSVHQDAIVAWVRIEDREFLVEEPGRTTVYHKEGQTTLSEQTVPTVRPKLEKGAIFTRRLNFAGLLGAPRKISSPGINIEPTIAFSTTGNQAYCVWVHDPIHKDLINSNLGRNLVYSVWTRTTDSWSAPRPVLANGDDYPGVLEPSIALKADGQGLLAFNAMDKGAPTRDTGLIGQNRFVFTCRLVNGVFGPPVKIHGLCGKRVMGRYQTVDRPPFLNINPEDLVFKRPPEWVLYLQQTDVPGLRNSAGQVLVAALGEGLEEFAAPVALTNDGRTHTNVVGTVWNAGLQSLNLKGVVAKIGAGGGGVVGDEGYETINAALDPDLALVSCLLSNQFAGAGAFVKATVEVENRGLACSATDRQGASLSSVRLVYLRIDGSETVEGEAALPELVPGQKATVEFEIEMPLDPVKLRAEVIAGPTNGPSVDRDPTNNAAQCSFGAPQPKDFRCSTFVTTTEAGDIISGALSWTNAALYDEITLFRDGCQIATLPTGSNSFVDHTAAPGPHLYEVRGSINASRSCRTRLECKIAPPQPAGALFRRGDVDMNGSLEITDPIKLLGYLFLGGAEPLCPDSTDADDNGLQDITDAIRILGYLFLGGVSPPAPGPDACGADVGVDTLGPCRAACQ